MTDTGCPVNTIELSNGTLTFIMRPDTATTFFIGSPKLKAGGTGLYILHPRFEAWPAGATAPTPNTMDPNITTTVNLLANEETPLTPTTVPGSRVVIAYDAIGPHR